MRDRLTEVAFLLGWRVVGALPEPVAYPLFSLVADLAWWRRGESVRQLEANLARAAAPSDPAALRALSRRAMRSYLRYWCDAFRLPGWSPERIVGSLRVENGHFLRDGLAGGKGLVAALSHQGNWDHAGAWSTFELAKVTTVAERLKPEAVFDRFVAFRERLGMEVLPLTGAGTIFGTLAQRLKAGGFVPLLCDRDLTDNGVEVTLLGEPARMAGGPAALALVTGAPLVPISTWYERRAGGWGLVLHIHPPVPVPPGRRREQLAAMMQSCADALGASIAAHPEDWHMLQRVFVADWPPPKAADVRIGMVSPYSFDVPGGVQFHLRDLAEHLIGQGHQVSVLAPADEDTPLPPYVESAGRAVPLKYNGSVARISFGPVSSARVKRWLADGEFDILHVHEPSSPSLSMLAMWAADGPIVATFHTSTLRSRSMQAAYPFLRPGFEKLSARIAVSEDARRTVVEHLGGDAVVIPNGVYVDRFAAAVPRADWQGTPDRPTLAFVGRLDEPRKGLQVLAAALPGILARRPGTRVLVLGRGDGEVALEKLGDEASAVELLGPLDDAAKASLLRSVDAYVAPHIGGESFGIVLVEAMSAGVPVVASALGAFRRVLEDGRLGVLVPTGDPAALADAVVDLLAEPTRAAQLASRASAAVRRYDWSRVAAQVLDVYETVRLGADGVAPDPAAHPRTLKLLARWRG